MLSKGLNFFGASFIYFFWAFLLYIYSYRVSGEMNSIFYGRLGTVGSCFNPGQESPMDVGVVKQCVSAF